VNSETRGSNFDNSELVWFRGKVVPRRDALVPMLSPTAQFGLNVFEGLRGYWNVRENCLYLFRLEDHLRRLMQSCKLIGIESPYSISEIRAALLTLLASIGYKCDIAVRIILFVDGVGSWATSSPVDMIIAPVSKPRRNELDPSGFSACVSSWTRIDDQTLTPRAKVGANYINSRYAQLDASQDGYDYPILLNRQGLVAEGAGACLMAVRNGQIATPPLTSSVLESITRESLIDLAASIGSSIEVREISRSELYISDELFLCGSSVELTPVLTLNRFRIGNGAVGPVTASLLSRYLNVVDGRDPSRRNWLTAVPNGG